MEYISRIEKGEYELVVRCDDYKQFKAFENMIRNEMARISSEKSWQRLAMDDFSKLTVINESDCKNCINWNGIFKTACDSCKRKGAETSKACNELHKHTEEEINSLKCELAAKSDETEELKGKLLHFEGLLKEKDDIISELKEHQFVKNVESKNGFDMWFLILAMCLLNSGNHDSYYKGKCDAYENILTPNKQEENMQKAREAFAELKKSAENFTNVETK